MGMPTDETLSLFDREGDLPLEILPNGEVKARGTSPEGIKPHTLGQDMGGEFAFPERITRDVKKALEQFKTFQLFNSEGFLVLKGFLQTNESCVYKCKLQIPVGYPHYPPNVFVLAPYLAANAPHIYRDGHLCLFVTSKWNPGRHNIETILGRTAQWLNKYDLWRKTGKWPGLSVSHNL